MNCAELDVIVYNDERWIVIKTFYKSTGEQTYIDCINGRGIIKHIHKDRIQENLGYIHLDAGRIHEHRIS